MRVCVCMYRPTLKSKNTAHDVETKRKGNMIREGGERNNRESGSKSEAKIQKKVMMMVILITTTAYGPRMRFMCLSISFCSAI
jgi:hypothetical protein